jgi:hypothetical protein
MPMRLINAGIFLGVNICASVRFQGREMRIKRDALQEITFKRESACGTESHLLDR